MMKINKPYANRVARAIMLATAFILSTMNGMAQNKQFTLEDLNFGGTNYHNMIPEYRNLTW